VRSEYLFLNKVKDASFFLFTCDVISVDGVMVSALSINRSV
jgi:hypothetical protein